MESFDVIIVGAGPAGLKCAETLGDSNMKVLLLEKNNIIGPKVCAGGLTGKDISYLHLPKDLIDFEYNKVGLNVNKTSSMIRQKDPFVWTIDRKNLGQWQLKRLKPFKNIEVRTGQRVSEIKKNAVIVDGKKINYSFLVGADGSSSAVRRYLGIKSKEIAVAIQYIIPTDKYKDLELFFDSKRFSTWYAWIFPHKGYVSIGCGCNPKLLPTKDLINHFKDWLDEKTIDISKGRFEAFTIDYDYQGHHFGNIFLAGDAAGFVSGFTGEGIYPALISGEEIGKMILDPKYKSQKIGRLLKVKEKTPSAHGFFGQMRQVKDDHVLYRDVFIEDPFSQEKSNRPFGVTLLKKE